MALDTFDTGGKTRRGMSKRDAYESPAARSIRAWALLYKGKHAGNVLIYYSDAGGVTATVSVWEGPFRAAKSANGHAGGGGYDKGGAALSAAAGYLGGKAPETVGRVGAAGLEECRRRFEAAGYSVAGVC